MLWYQSFLLIKLKIPWGSKILAASCDDFQYILVAPPGLLQNPFRGMSYKGGVIATILLPGD